MWKREKTLMEKRELLALNALLEEKENDLKKITKEFYDLKAEALLKEHRLKVGDTLKIKHNIFVVTYAPWFGIVTEKAINNLALAPYRKVKGICDARFSYLTEETVHTYIKIEKVTPKSVIKYLDKDMANCERRDIYGTLRNKKSKR